MNNKDQEEVKALKHKMVNNVGIFTKIMEQDDNNKDLLNNANFLLFCLEENLLRLTHRKISLYDF